MKETKEQRLQIVNEIIATIAANGRRFFYNKEDGDVAKMLFINNRLYFVDDYTKDKIYAYAHKYFYNGFSHGGTLQALILDFSYFIRFGTYSNGKNGYSGLYCSYWDYDKESQDKVVKRAIELGYLKKESEQG